MLNPTPDRAGVTTISSTGGPFLLKDGEADEGIGFQVRPILSNHFLTHLLILWWYKQQFMTNVKMQLWATIVLYLNMPFTVDLNHLKKLNLAAMPANNPKTKLSTNKTTKQNTIQHAKK